MRQRENSESPWGIKPQAFGFCAPMLYHWATETPQWARSIMKLIWHASCILLYEIGNRPLSPWSFCDSVVGHRSAESEGLSFDSSLGRRIFPLSHVRDKTKNIFLYHLPHINYIHYRYQGEDTEEDRERASLKFGRKTWVTIKGVNTEEDEQPNVVTLSQTRPSCY